MRIIAAQLVSQQYHQTSCTLVLPVFPHLKGLKGNKPTFTLDLLEGSFSAFSSES